MCVDTLGYHVEGLTVAGKKLQAKHLVAQSTKAKLRRIDEVFHLTRHVTSRSVEAFLDRLAGELEQGTTVSGETMAAHSGYAQVATHCGGTAVREGTL